jgi:uroporphyrinogen III methyltransferase/synthase
MSDDSSTGKPLRDKTVLVACSAKKMSVLADGLRALGARVLLFPIIEIRDIEDKSRMNEALASLNQYAWIVFTSAHGVTRFAHQFHQRRIRREILNDVKICAIGPATAKSLQENGFRVDLVPERFVAEGVIEALETCSGGLRSLSGRRILIPRAKEARDVLPNALAAAGASVDIVVCYQTVKAEVSDEEIRRFTDETPDLLVFTSSSTVKNTMEVLGYDAGKKLLEKSAVAAIGPITADTVESFDKSVEIIPKESTIASLIRAIEEYFSQQ